MPNITTKNKEQLYEIIEKNAIRSVYQPIISLKDGTVFGYEALSRITLADCTFNIGEAFEIANELNILWSFEHLCRINSLKNSINKPQEAKLFVNVDPNIIHDLNFKSGVTKKKLSEYNLNCDDIIFEATERSAISDITTFKESLKHYKEQGFGIAVDDVGSGYSGINRIFDINPQFIKIDMSIIKDVDKDEYKRSFIKALAQFAKDVDLPIIAEGIETYEQLDIMICLGIQYAQGFYLSKPSEKFETLTPDQVSEIKKIHKKRTANTYQPMFFDVISTVSKKKNYVLPTTCLVDIYNQMKSDSEITEICVVDSNGRYLGLLTNHFVLQSFSGMYGYSLNSHRKASDVMDTEALTVEKSKSIESVAKIAMSRCQKFVYDSIVVVDKDKYFGVFSVKNLLETAINIQIKRATECNPLTGLPGNITIESEIRDLIRSDKPFALIYIDIDNFKAYNDAYGFNNGDLMIKAVADTILLSCSAFDFKGHIGGDDFVIITSNMEIQELCQKIISIFTESIQELYNETDRANGYIISTNRNGLIESFPLTSLSIAVITNEEITYESISELSLTIAKTKKQAKKLIGNSIVVA